MVELFARIFAITVSAGVLLVIAWWRMRPGRLRTALQWLAAFLLLVPQVAMLLLLDSAAPLFLYQEGLVTLWLTAGATLLVLAFLGRFTSGGRPYAGLMTSHRGRRWLLGLVAIALSGAAARAGWKFSCDLVLPARNIDGQVLAVQKQPNRRVPRLPRLYDVRIGNAVVHATRDIAAQLDTGIAVRAVVTAGSGCILSVKRVPASRRDPARATK